MLFKQSPKDGNWYSYTPWFFVRLHDGSISRAFGKVWRRWNGKKWEYRQDPETDEDFDARQY